MKILSTFDKVVTEVLADKVRARLTFKVHSLHRRSHPGHTTSAVTGDQSYFGSFNQAYLLFFFLPGPP
jgi:hypothetical protein